MTPPAHRHYVHEQAVAPRSAMHDGAGTGMHRSWQHHARMAAAVSLGCCLGLLCMSFSRPGVTELEPVVSAPVMGTGGGPTTPPADDGSEISKPVMGSACVNCNQIDGPTVHLSGTWKNYSIDYNVFGLHVWNGGLTDADAPGALPENGRNEWESNFTGFDFKPSDRRDGPDLQAEAIFNGVQHHAEITFNGYPHPPQAPSLDQSGGGSTLAGGAGATGADSAASQASAIISSATSDATSLTAAATAAESTANAGNSASGNGGETPAGDHSGGNEDGGSPSNIPTEEKAASGGSDNQASSVNADNSEGGSGASTTTASGGEGPPALGNNCFLLPSLCPQYSPPFPGLKGTGSDVVHVDGDPPPEKENDGSEPPQNVNPEANNVLGEDSLGPLSAELPADPPPPTPAPYHAEIFVDTGSDNGAEGMGEGIAIDTSNEAKFVGGAPVESAAALGKPTQLLTKEEASDIPRLQTLAELRASSFPTFSHTRHSVRPRWRLIKLQSDEDVNGDTSQDNDSKNVDDELAKTIEIYDKMVGTKNFGSRGMTDKRNDFLEGTSGSKFGGPATSVPGSNRGYVSELVGFVPTGWRVLAGARRDRQNKLQMDIPIEQVLEESTSGESENEGNDETSGDAEMQAVDDDLKRVIDIYDHRVGTVNFGSRGMTDKRNDFLEGTSGSSFGGPPTSKPDSS